MCNVSRVAFLQTLNSGSTMAICHFTITLMELAWNWNCVPSLASKNFWLIYDFKCPPCCYPRLLSCTMHLSIRKEHNKLKWVPPSLSLVTMAYSEYCGIPPFLSAFTSKWLIAYCLVTLNSHVDLKGQHPFPPYCMALPLSLCTLWPVA